MLEKKITERVSDERYHISIFRDRDNKKYDILFPRIFIDGLIEGRSGAIKYETTNSGVIFSPIADEIKSQNVVAKNGDYEKKKLYVLRKLAEEDRISYRELSRKVSGAKRIRGEELKRILNELETGDYIKIEHRDNRSDLISYIGVGTEANSFSLRTLIEKYENGIIKSVLKMTAGNLTRTARILQISRQALYKKLEKYGIHQ